MSLAWGSLALLVALLPGVLFFVGLQFPEKFTRDAADRSALGQLAGVLLVSILVHGALYLYSPVPCKRAIPCVDVEQFLAFLSLEKPEAGTISRIAANIAANRFWIFTYLLFSSGLGLLLGWAVGTGIVGGRLRVLGQHGWAHRLSVKDQLTTAWVLTHIRDVDRVLVYGGFLDAFHLKKDGTFSYLVLTHVRRLYLQLKMDAPITQITKAVRIGDSARLAEKDELRKTSKRFRESRFVIEGEDIANVVFDRYEIAATGRVTDVEFRAQGREALRVYRASLSSRVKAQGELTIEHVRPPDSD